MLGVHLSCNIWGSSFLPLFDAGAVAIDLYCSNFVLRTQRLWKHFFAVFTKLQLSTSNLTQFFAKFSYCCKNSINSPQSDAFLQEDFSFITEIMQRYSTFFHKYEG